MSDPAQPFAASQEVDNNGQKTAGWRTKKFREEYETAKSRLTDQKFDISKWLKVQRRPFESCGTLRADRRGDAFANPASILAQYADPLMPQGPNAIQSSAVSHSFSPETEKRLQDFIAEIKSSSATS